MNKELGQNKWDVLAASSRSITGIIPFAGPLLSELVGSVIPNQRIDRLTKYVVELDKKLSDLSEELINKKLKDEDCIDLFEEGFVQASRAITDERREYIASVVRNGLDEDSIAFSESKYLMKILQELNEQEVIWLRFYLDPTMNSDNKFREKHQNILRPATEYYGADDSEFNRAAFQRSFKQHLERLGLIQNKETTRLGRLLLKQIGLIDEDAF